jgi:hypothetical protein
LFLNNKLCLLGRFSQSLQKELAKRTPLSNDELKIALPKSLIGIKRTKYTVGQQMYVKVSTAEADYKKDRHHNIHLSIWDGAGKAGSSLVALRIWELKRNFEQKTQNSFDKSIKLNGRQAEVQQKKYDDGRLTSQIDFAVTNRFLITLKGRGFTEEDLEKAYKDLDFSSLK